MIGAIIGDIVGSRFKWDNHRSKEFELFTGDCFATDDSIMTLAIGKALMESENDWNDLGEQAVRCMQEVGRPYPHCGYGGRFWDWMYSDHPKPYNSFGNGAAMRVSACGFVARSLEEAKALSKAVTEVTHNHPEGLKGAEATVVAIYMARIGSTIEEIRDVIDQEYYPINFTLDEIRDTYAFNETCQDTVPQALEAFFESNSFEDAMFCLPVSMLLMYGGRKAKQFCKLSLRQVLPQPCLFDSGSYLLQIVVHDCLRLIR